MIVDVSASYRTRSAVVVQYGASVLAVLFISLPALVSTLNGTFGDGSAAGAFFVALGLVMAVLAWRGARSEVVANDDGVVIVNPLRRHVVPWSAVSAFRLGRWGLLPRQGMVELRDGSHIAMWAISARNPNVYAGDPRAERMVSELAERLRRSSAG
jgi:hypothetical protein